jgi:endonuclease/exonuclease/phosphatase family metal-dependent hydrolase
LAGIGAGIERQKPDICILQEVDLNARRTGRRNVAEELARRFQLNYVFGVEFQELGQGSRDAPAYVGQALLSALPIRSSYILRFVKALVVEIEAAGATLIVYNVHLESRGHESLRLSQLEEIIADAKRYRPGIPLIVAGDLNTNSQDSPVVKRLAEAGFRNAIGEEKAVTSLRGASLDWIFVRGPIRFENGKIHQEIVASDHYPLSVSIHSLSGS